MDRQIAAEISVHVETIPPSVHVIPEVAPEENAAKKTNVFCFAALADK